MLSYPSDKGDPSDGSTLSGGVTRRCLSFGKILTGSTCLGPKTTWVVLGSWVYTWTSNLLALTAGSSKGYSRDPLVGPVVAPHVPPMCPQFPRDNWSRESAVTRQARWRIKLCVPPSCLTLPARLLFQPQVLSGEKSRVPLTRPGIDGNFLDRKKERVLWPQVLPGWNHGLPWQDLGSSLM